MFWDRDKFFRTPDIYHNNPDTFKQYGIGSQKNDILLSHEKLDLVPGKSGNLQLFMGQDSTFDRTNAIFWNTR